MWQYLYWYQWQSLIDSCGIGIKAHSSLCFKSSLLDQRWRWGGGGPRGRGCGGGGKRRPDPHRLQVWIACRNPSKKPVIEHFRELKELQRRRSRIAKIAEEQQQRAQRRLQVPKWLVLKWIKYFLFARLWLKRRLLRGWRLTNSWNPRHSSRSHRIDCDEPLLASPVFDLPLPIFINMHWKKWAVSCSPYMISKCLKVARHPLNVSAPSKPKLRDVAESYI